MRQVAVIGAGAAGLRAAIEAARNGAAVTLLEHLEKPGKKLLLTGNGRCNLTNLDPNLPERYHSLETSGPDAVIRSIFKQESTADTLAFFRDLGLLTTDRDGYVYPYSQKSSSVLQTLLNEAERLKIKMKFGCHVDRLEYDTTSATFRIHMGGYALTADACILACGSLASPACGCDGSGYELARQAGHRVTRVLPALTGLICRAPWLDLCAGARTHARVTLITDQGRFSETGEVQWAANGISGIVVFQLSRFASAALDHNQQADVLAKVDLFPEMSLPELQSMITAMAQASPDQRSAAALMSCLLAPAMVKGILSCLKLKKLSAQQLREPAMAKRIVEALKGLSIQVTGVRSYDQAQVCMGGIPLDEVDPETLESRCCRGLYLIGEMLDIDGPCGGYNLQWAWSSGAVAGRAAALGFNS